jgi:hypothetical protein
MQILKLSPFYFGTLAEMQHKSAWIPLPRQILVFTSKEVGTRKTLNLSFDIQLDKSSSAMVNRDQKEVRIAMVSRWYSVFKGTDYGSGI